MPQWCECCYEGCLFSTFIPSSLRQNPELIDLTLSEDGVVGSKTLALTPSSKP